MTLNRSGTGLFCSNNDLHFLATECTRFSGSSQGCATTYAYRCNLGVNSQKLTNVKPYQKTGFMPTAIFTGTLSDCTIGQVLQETITSNGHTAMNPTINPTSVSGSVSIAGHTVDVDNSASNRFPQVGATGTGGRPKFGGDYYSSPAATNVLFNTTSSTVSWWDNPDQSKDSQGEAASWSFKFLSFVNGSAGQAGCACAFDIAVSWASNGTPTTTWNRDAALSTNCTF